LSNPFIQATPEQIEQMLDAIGAKSVDEIFNDQIPSQLQYTQSHNLPPALSELELQPHLTRLAAKNRATTDFVSFMGGGIYDHFVPTAIMHVANRSEYVTGYTPYQPEASQGLLQAFFEYQTMISRLYDMPVSNASLYDGASALGEAVFMALGIHPDRNRIVMSDSVHPHYRELVQTYMAHFNTKVDIIKHSDGRTDIEALDEYLGEDVAAVVVQHPNYFGCLEQVKEIEQRARKAGALFIVIADPISLGYLAPPGTYNADIAIGEGQPLGLNQYAGCETVGIFTCKSEFIRKVPGRLVGVTKDKEDRRGFVLTLQTREQHIRRAKATSNICTNHAHNALRSSIYMCLMGPGGMGQVARACARNTQRLRSALQSRKANAIAFTPPSFKEFVVQLARPAAVVRDELMAQGYLAGIPLSETMGAGYENQLLVAVTEKRTDNEIDSFADVLGGYL
jgi:glycine dehydrogenase subunit 1